MKQVSPGKALARREDVPDASLVIDVSTVAVWLRRNKVVLIGLLIIVAELAWKAQILSHSYFQQDDYVDLDLAISSPFSWHYLSLVGAGHLFPGLRAITWVIARISLHTGGLYNWGLDAGVEWALLAAASLAALRVLRTLFGDRLAILVPLAIYALTPLTVPDLSWWWAAMESLPLQLSIFMALDAHVRYIRHRRSRHLAAAGIWLAVGMLFFEKGVVLAPLLFAITAGFLTQTNTWMRGATATIREHWRIWLVYGVLVVGYVIMFVESFRASAQHAASPNTQWTYTFAVALVKNTLMTGAIGGPWQWFPEGTGLFAFAAPPPAMVFLAGVVAVGVIAVSIGLRRIAWRAWTILFGWVLCADVVPVSVGRDTPGYQSLLGLQTRYVAETACVLAICVGLAFLPVLGAAPELITSAWRRLIAAEARDTKAHGDHPGTQSLRYALAGLVSVFVAGSVWSVQAYESATPGAAAVRSYVANFDSAVHVAPRGLQVLNVNAPQNVVSGLFGRPTALMSTVIGDVAPGKLHWVRDLPRGTIDNLWMFGEDGKLYPAVMAGVYTIPRNGQGTWGFCWPKTRHGRSVVSFPQTTTIYDWTLKIAYIWGSAPGFVTVDYGKSAQRLSVIRGLHSAYLPVSGQVSKFSISGPGAGAMCVVDAQAGRLVPYGSPIR